MNLIKKILLAQATVLALWAASAQAMTDEEIAQRIKPVGEV
ncbi:MAG: cytochrome c5 family protein, partial [Gammaproteobacteria bacterium]|nr:cytochrome c5 family protein [Gammaproteobacteria bacterium]